MRTRSLYLALAIVLLCPYASAQWLQTNGPSNVDTYCLAVSGTNLFAGTYNGIFRSSDNGTSWTVAD